MTRKIRDSGILGQDQVRYKIVTDNRCLQKLKKLNILDMKFLENLKRYSTKTGKICSKNFGNFNNTFKSTLAHKFSTITVYNALVLPIILYGIEI